MKIVILSPKADFTKDQQKSLSSYGEVSYIDPPLEHPIQYFIDASKAADIIGISPENFGGFEKAKERVTQLLKTITGLKGIALGTTSFGWVDLEYCKKFGITVCNIPGYSRESVAEHTIALLLAVAKRILITDRRTQKGQYKMELGFELKGKTLGIIGLGSIGSRVAELAQALGMDVMAYNLSPKKQPGVTMTSLDELLRQSDAITIHVTHDDKNKGIITKKEIDKMKNNVILINTADRIFVDETDMANALKVGKVYGYAYEAEDLKNTPLAAVENAFGIQGFGWYTHEALQNLNQIWVDNIEALVKDKPQNVVT